MNTTFRLKPADKLEKGKMKNQVTRNDMNQMTKSDVRRKNLAKTGAAVAVGMAGAAAGAALGVALSDKKNRDRLIKLATEARDALERFALDLRESVDEVEMDSMKKKAKQTLKKVANQKILKSGRG